MFLGEPSEALQLLRQAGMLEGLDPDKKVGPGESETAGEQPIGLVLKAWPSYYDWATLMVRSGGGEGWGGEGEGKGHQMRWRCTGAVLRQDACARFRTPPL